MAISGQQVIAVGLQNESANSDSLYTAFNKTVDNFATLFACASPYNTFIGSDGIDANTNSNTSIITITNTGVLSLTAGDSSINLTGSNGNITITATGGGNGGGGVSSVGVSSSTLTVSNSPILSAGNIVLNLTSTGITPGTYNNPTLGVDSYGRVTSIVNNTVAGTVTSVGITPGSGILVTNSPITSAGSITVTNTGVTRIAAGTGISVSGSNGNVTISTTASGGTVTGITVTSNTLTVTGGTITSSGVITVDLPSTISVTGNITGGNLITTGNAIVGGIKTDNYYYANGTPLDMQQPAGSNTQIQFNNANDFGASANLTFNTSTNTLSATNIAGSLTTAAQANITSVGTLASLSVSGNANVGNIGATTFVGALSGAATTAGTVTTAAQPNITSTGTLASLSVSGNANVGNIGTGGLITASGNITGNFFIGNGSQLTGLGGPSFTAKQTVYQNLASSPSSISSLALIYDTVVANTDSGYNATTGIFTAPRAGYYQVSGSIGINILANTSAGGSGALVMYHNANTYAAGPFVQAFEAISGNSLTTVVSQSSLSTLVYLNTSDTVQLKLGYITNATANQWTTETNLVPSSFQAAWIRS